MMMEDGSQCYHLNSDLLSFEQFGVFGHKCKDCDHITWHKSKSKTNISDYSGICHQCKKEFPSLKGHYESKHPYPCGMCSANFTQRSDLSEHELMMHLNDLLLCAMCSFSKYESLAELINHFNESYGSCRICRIVFETQHPGSLTAPIDSDQETLCNEHCVNIHSHDVRRGIYSKNTMPRDKRVQVRIEIGHQAVCREKASDKFTHDFNIFVRGVDGVDISHFVEKVQFYLHESYPKPKRTVKKPPYNIEERGYGSFNLPVYIYFRTEDPKRHRIDYDLFLQFIIWFVPTGRQTQQSCGTEYITCRSTTKENHCNCDLYSTILDKQ